MRAAKPPTGTAVMSVVVERCARASSAGRCWISSKAEVAPSAAQRVAVAFAPKSGHADLAGRAAVRDDLAVSAAPRAEAMYATVRRYEGITDPAGVARIIRERFVPLMTKIDGFVAYHWVDAGDGVMVATTVFEDQAGVDSSNETATAFIRDEDLGNLYPNPAQVTVGEVVAAAAA